MKRAILALAAAASATHAAAGLRPPEEPKSSRADARAAEAVVENRVGKDEPGLAVLVRKDGKTVLEHAWGAA